MALDPNSWRPSRPFRQQRWEARFNELRLRLHRSPNGLALGVFRGIAESLGYRVKRVRWIGCIALLLLSGSVGGAHGFKANLLVAGFFYLLAAVLMKSPDGTDTLGRGDFVPNGASDPGQTASMPPPFPARAARRPGAVPFQEVVPPAPRVDFAALDRQLDGLNRRIQRMEGIVTDRNYDWDRRMQGK